MQIRPTRAGDVPALQKVLDETGLFPSDMLASMYETDQPGETGEAVWLGCVMEQRTVGFGYTVRRASNWRSLALPS
jgi:hypothetical protein